MTATKKLTAYGAVVVAALVMGFALLTAAFAAPSVGDASLTVTESDATRRSWPLTTTVARYRRLDVKNGKFSIVTQPASGGSVTAAN